MSDSKDTWCGFSPSLGVVPGARCGFALNEEVRALSIIGAMFFALDTPRLSYVLFHKLTLCFLKLAGLDPNGNLNSQLRRERPNFNWLVKLLSWIYSPSILALLLASLVVTMRFHISGVGLHNKFNVVFFLWSAAIGCHCMSLLVVFMVRSQRVSRINDIFIRWMENYFSNSRVSVTVILVWALYVLTASALPAAFVVYTKVFETNQEKLYFIMEILNIFINSFFLLFFLYTREICMEIIEVCLTLLEAHDTAEEQQSLMETPNLFLKQRGRQ